LQDQINEINDFSKVTNQTMMDGCALFVNNKDLVM